MSQIIPNTHQGNNNFSTELYHKNGVEIKDEQPQFGTNKGLNGSLIELVESSGQSEPPSQEASLLDDQETYFPFFDSDEIFDLPPKEWLVQNIFGEGDIGVIFGAPGSGKTFVTIDLILACCTGAKFAVADDGEGGFDVDRPLSTVYCAGEGVSGVGQRFQAAFQRYGVHQPGQRPKNLLISKVVPQLFDEKRKKRHINRFIQEWKRAERGPLDVLVIDTLHTATIGANENDSHDMGIVIDTAKLARDELGCAVILVHHSGKNDKYRGSSALHGDVDFMVEIKRNGTRRMECYKLKDGDEWKPQQFDLTGMGPSVRCFWEGEQQTETQAQKQTNREAIYQFLEKNSGNQYTKAQIVELAKINERSAERCLKLLCDSGEITKGDRGQDGYKYWVD